MNEQEHDALRTGLGAYALGQLPADEAAHARGAPRRLCRVHAELAELTPVAAALSDLRTAAAPEQDGDAPPTDLGNRVVAAVATTARAERRTSAGCAPRVSPRPPP